nr:UDP-glucose 4-epimerase GalE [Neptunicella marina]
MKVLITGGAGYIGSHTLLQLLEDNYQAVVLDNLSNSSEESLKRVKQLSGKSFEFIKGDICDKPLLEQIFNQHKIDAVIHFAGLKAVGESVQKPLTYYRNNVMGSVILFEAMADAQVKNLVFSSSATVYGDPVALPLNEQMPEGKPTNPYGQSKLMIENILKDLYLSDPSWNITLLRYFNPVGAHSSGRIGEDPTGIPNNLMPFVAQVATGKRKELSVFGDDYDTPDGTGVRDYIHVEDLAAGHVKAIKNMTPGNGLKTYNLGTGNGYSVLDMVKAFEQASGKTVAYKICPRRDGDVAACYADPSLAAKDLNWRAEKGISEMCEDTWRWQSQNPDGYKA